MAPILSIVVPVYNAGKYLDECLDSLCAQTVRDIEIVCVNDGSSDNSAEILAGHAARDPRIRVITQQNQGAAATRMNGIMAASGKWIGFVDSDDTVTADMYERLLSNGEKYRTDISHCGMVFIYPDGNEVLHHGTGMLKLQDHETGLLDLLDGSQTEPSMCSKIYRAELFPDMQWDTSVRHNEDFACNFDLFSKASSAVYEDFCGYRYRKHAGSKSASFKISERQRIQLSIRKKIVEKSPENIYPAAYRLWLSTLVHSMNLLCTASDSGAPAFYTECRKTLLEEKENISCLSRKQRISAKLHLKCPAAARRIYRIYGKYAQYRYEH